MASLRSKIAKRVIRRVIRPGYERSVDVAKLRKLDRLTPHRRHVAPCVLTSTIMGSLPVHWLRGPKRNGRLLLLYLHGGGYVCGPNAYQWRMISRLTNDLEATAVVPLYRVAPEHTHPAASQDAIRVYDDLLATHHARQIIILGDSAGAGLALSVAQQLRETGRPMPWKLVLISPWLDVELTNPEIEPLVDLDPCLAPEGLREAGRLYAGETPTSDPHVSPIHGDLAGLPPTQLLIGTHDILLADCRKFHERAQATDGFVLEYHEAQDMFHDWPTVLPLVPEAWRATQRMEAFIRRPLSGLVDRERVIRRWRDSALCE